MATLQAGNSYRAQVAVINGSTKNGLSVAATLIVNVQVGLFELPSLLLNQSQSIAFAAGGTQNPSFTFTIPQGTAGYSGLIQALVRAPDGTILARAMASLSIGALVFTPTFTTTDVLNALNLDWLSDYYNEFGTWYSQGKIDYNTYLTYYNAYSEAYTRLTTPTAIVTVTPTPTTREQCLVDAQAFYDNITAQYLSGQITYEEYMALYNQYSNQYTYCLTL